MSLLDYTGKPRIRIADDASAAWLDLPYPSADNFMSANRTSRSVWNEYADGRQERVGAAKWQRRFSFAYDYLDNATAASLLAILETEHVEFIPRSGVGAPSFECRVMSDLPDTSHLTRGFEIEIELLCIEAIV